MTVKFTSVNSQKFAATRGWLFFLLCMSLSVQVLAWPPEEVLSWGLKAEDAVCPDLKSYVSVRLRGAPSCLRYFSNDNLTDVDTAVVVLYGDREDYINVPLDNIRANTRIAQERRARNMARIVDAPLFILARPGTYGSSGDHRKKKTLLEIEAIDLALSELKARYRIRRFVVVGHSGGALVAAALLTKGRDDIRCAVLVSAPFNLMDRARKKHLKDQSEDLPASLNKFYRSQYDPLEHVHGVVRDQERMIYLLGNPADKITPYDNQLMFFNALLGAGHRVAIEQRGTSDPAGHQISYKDSLKQAKVCFVDSR